MGMQAVWYERMGPARGLTLGELAIPEPGHDEVLVKVMASGSEVLLLLRAFPARPEAADYRSNVANLRWRLKKVRNSCRRWT